MLCEIIIRNCTNEYCQVKAKHKKQNRGKIKDWNLLFKQTENELKLNISDTHIFLMLLIKDRKLSSKPRKIGKKSRHWCKSYT